jgi:hypothetical protein
VEQRKRDDARLILDDDMTRFYTDSDSPESKNSTFNLALLICGFSLLISISLMEFGLLLL